MMESSEDRVPEETGSEVEAREPLSRPTSPQRNPRAARTIVSFDWQPFERDIVPAEDEKPVVAQVAETPMEPRIEDPVPGYDPRHRTLEKLAALLKKVRRAS